MNTFETHLAEARNQLQNEQLAEAICHYRKALTNCRNEQKKATVWAEIAWTYYRMNEFERTIEAVENVFHFNPQYKAPEDLYRTLGLAYVALGQDEPAMDNLSKSLALDRHSPKQQIALYELAKIHFKHQNHEEAYKIFHETEAYFFQNQKEYWLSVLFYKGFIQYYNLNYMESEAIFEELLENANDGVRKATALFGLAFVAFAKKDYLKTINLCESLIKHDPDFFDAETVGFLTAASFYYLGRHDVFEMYYHQLKKNFPAGRYDHELTQLKKNLKNINKHN